MLHKKKRKLKTETKLFSLMNFFYCQTYSCEMTMTKILGVKI